MIQLHTFTTDDRSVLALVYDCLEQCNTYDEFCVVFTPEFVKRSFGKGLGIDGIKTLYSEVEEYYREYTKSETLFEDLRPTVLEDKTLPLPVSNPRVVSLVMEYINACSTYAEFERNFLPAWTRSNLAFELGMSATVQLFEDIENYYS